MVGTGRKAQPFGRRALPWKDCPAFALRNVITPTNFSGRQPDGGWATAQEAAYPPGLCSQFALLVFPSATATGRFLPAEGCR